jgi:CubicO group peptidase (beta-lactamase class C family)
LRQRLILYPVALIAFAITITHAQVRSDLAQKIDNYFRAYAANQDFNGVVLVAKGDKVLFTRAYGYADYELTVPNTLNTKFRIASLTKSFTAAAIVMLEERGRLSFDDKLSKFLPNYPNGDKISVLNLLRHEGGIAELGPDDRAILYASSLDETISKFSGKPLLFEPGSDGRYSNTGFTLLAKVVEVVSGGSFDRFLQENIFKPLGMNDSGNFANADLIPDRANGYVPGPPPYNLRNAVKDDLSRHLGNGSMYSTAADLYRWLRAVKNEKLFKMSTLKYPYGWGREEQFGHKSIEQAGIHAGFVSLAQYYLDDDIYVVYLSNIQTAISGTVSKDVAAIIFSQPFKIPVARNAPVESSLETLKGLLGAYRANQRLAFQLLNRNGDLYLRWLDDSEEKYLTPVAANEFLLREELTVIQVVRDGNKTVTDLKWLSPFGNLDFRPIPVINATGQFH